MSLYRFWLCILISNPDAEPKKNLNVIMNLLQVLNSGKIAHNTESLTSSNRTAHQNLSLIIHSGLGSI